MVRRWPRALAARKSGTVTGRPSRLATAPLPALTDALVLVVMTCSPLARSDGSGEVRSTPRADRPWGYVANSTSIIDRVEKRENASRLRRPGKARVPPREGEAPAEPARQDPPPPGPCPPL